jgi:hypothetical protein
MPRWDRFAIAIRGQAAISIRLTALWLLVNNPQPATADATSRTASPTTGGWLIQGNVKGGRMNKSDLIDAMAEAADVPKTTAARALDAFTDSIAVALKEGGTVSIIGFGTFGQRTGGAHGA